MSISEKYHGYCIGGPYARQHRVHWSDKLVAPVMKELCPVVSDYDAAMDKAEISNFVYQHVQHFYVTEGEGETVLNFWVSATERHPRRFVLEELLRSYVNTPPNPNTTEQKGE